MKTAEHDRLTSLIGVLRPLAQEYPGQTIDSILRQLEARASEVMPHAQVTRGTITINPDGSMNFSCQCPSSLQGS